VEIEPGETISAPLFVNEGDIIRINTDTGEYVERA
jgi:elongation factor P